MTQFRNEFQALTACRRHGAITSLTGVTPS
jgi:hypothetical protein